MIAEVADAPLVARGRRIDAARGGVRKGEHPHVLPRRAWLRLTPRNVTERATCRSAAPKQRSQSATFASVVTPHGARHGSRHQRGKRLAATGHHETQQSLDAQYEHNKTGATKVETQQRTTVTPTPRAAIPSDSATPLAPRNVRKKRQGHYSRTETTATHPQSATPPPCASTITSHITPLVHSKACLRTTLCPSPPPVRIRCVSSVATTATSLALLTPQAFDLHTFRHHEVATRPARHVVTVTEVDRQSTCTIHGHTRVITAPQPPPHTPHIARRHHSTNLVCTTNTTGPRPERTYTTGLPQSYSSIVRFCRPLNVGTFTTVTSV